MRWRSPRRDRRSRREPAGRSPAPDAEPRNPWRDEWRDHWRDERRHEWRRSGAPNAAVGRARSRPPATVRRYVGCFILFVILVASLVLALGGWLIAAFYDVLVPGGASIGRRRPSVVARDRRHPGDPARRRSASSDRPSARSPRSPMPPTASPTASPASGSGPGARVPSGASRARSTRWPSASTGPATTAARCSPT